MTTLLSFFLITLSYSAFSQDLFGNNPFNEAPPTRQESPERQKQRAISMAQRAVFSYPMPRKIKTNVEKKFTEVMGKELAATIGAMYIAIREKEISTRYIRHITIPFAGGGIRPDLGVQLEQENTYGAIYFVKKFP